jgi:hypothetical protein
MAVKTRTQLLAEITANITTNASGDITGAVLNALLENIVDSLEMGFISYTSAQITAAISVGAFSLGDVYYDTDKKRYEYFNGTSSKYVGETLRLQEIFKASGNTDVTTIQDDDWQILENSGDLIVQKRVAGAWVTKGIITTIIATVVTSSPFTITGALQYLIDDDTIGAAATVNLPAAAGGGLITIKKIGSTANVTIDGNGAETIDGTTTIILTSQYESVSLVSDGSNWFII